MPAFFKAVVIDMRVALGFSRAVLAAVLLVGLLSAAHAETPKCNIIGSEYVPQHPVIEKTYNKNENIFNRTLSFVLTIERGDGESNFRSTFLNFNAYDQTGRKVSTMRFGDVWSNGVSRQSFAAETGQYYDPKDESTWVNFKGPGFMIIGVNEDFSQAQFNDAPHLLIFPETYIELNYKSYQYPQDWDHYIKFYTEGRIYPDFRGYDFWVRKKCGGEVNK